jgi:hypothetical protein
MNIGSGVRTGADREIDAPFQQIRPADLGPLQMRPTFTLHDAVAAPRRRVDEFLETGHIERAAE